MSIDQAAIIALVGLLLIAYASERFRIEVVALAGLGTAIAWGLVPFPDAFSGFSNPAVVTVAEILLLVGVLTRTRLIDRLAAILAARLRGERAVIAAVCGLGAAVSVFMNNIGALALMLPLTVAVCRAASVRLGHVLIPLSFATLLGGTCSLIGTPANLVVSSVRTEALGAPFGFFDLAVYGGPATLLGLGVLVALAPILLAGRGDDGGPPPIAGPRRFLAEFKVPAVSPLIGLTVDQAEHHAGGTIHAHIRAGRHVFGRRDAVRILAGDVVLIEADVADAIALRERGDADLVDDGAADWAEAVVLPQSTVIGSTARGIAAFEHHGVTVAAMSPQTSRIEGRLADVRIAIGDVLLLRGRREAIDRAIEDTDCLAVSPRGLAAIQPSGPMVLAVFAAAVTLAATGLLPPEIAFGAAVLALALSGFLDLRTALASLNWPVLLMLAALIPIGTAFQETGAAAVIAQGLLDLTGASGAVAVIAVILTVAVIVTPFVNNVSAATALAPIALSLAEATGLPPDPILMAVAVAVSFDFLTPFGHHNNTIVMSVGAYRFADFVRLGLPVLVVCAGSILLIAAMKIG
ncbi:SLC13 family permease [Mongoliimonas terrestris]|uniref:SLC13 family permease n=1 Tax=Mongoliimonas terrestris TaxID=1709001 RepID=UPI000949A01B|nr:SLC13 family permease [Mongoliimonas terrestris]